MLKDELNGRYPAKLKVYWSDDVLETIRNDDELNASIYRDCHIRQESTADDGTLLLYLDEDDVDDVPDPNEVTRYETRIDAVRDKYSIPQIIGFVYDLYQAYLIRGGTADTLYSYVDPDEKYNDVSEYWDDTESGNPLT